jgi:hypothetical protein
VVYPAGGGASPVREAGTPWASCERLLPEREVSSLTDVCVVLDTNAIWDNWLVKGLAWKVLAAKAAGDNPKIHLRFPETVLDEATSKFQSEAQKRISQLKATANFLEDEAADDGLEVIVAALTEHIDGYRDTLEDKLTDYLQGQMLPYPSISHADMTKRALERRAPFDDNGGGYRDSLIWLAALEEAENVGADLIIVSNDNAFKAVGKGKGKDQTTDDGGAPPAVAMDPRLVEEAAEHGIKASLTPTIKDLVAALVPLPAELGPSDSTAWHTFVAVSGDLDAIVEFLDEELAEPDVTPVLDAETAGLPAQVTDFDINWVEDVGDVKLSFVSALDDGRIACTFIAAADVEFSVGVYEGTAEMLEWTITGRYGHDEVRALVHKRATVEGLLTLSSTGEPVAVEDVSWSAEPDMNDYSFADDDDCVVIRRTTRRTVTIRRRA